MKIIVAEILNKEGEITGYRIVDPDKNEVSDMSVEATRNLLEGDGLSALLGGIDGLNEIAEHIANAGLVKDEIKVEGFDKKPIQIDQAGMLISKASHSMCGFNPYEAVLIIADYNGEIKHLSIKETRKLIAEVGLDKIANSDLLEAIEKREKEEEANKPKTVYTAENAPSIPAAWLGNDVVKQVYGEVLKVGTDAIIGAHILNRKMKFVKGVLRSNVLTDEGEVIAAEDSVIYDVDNDVVSTFVLLETTSKRFITVPVCKAFEELLSSFTLKDITVKKFHDFIDFLTEEIDELDLGMEKTISKLLGSDIKDAEIDNTENVTVYVEDGQPMLDYEIMDATIRVTITVKKKTDDIELVSFPWVMS